MNPEVKQIVVRVLLTGLAGCWIGGFLSMLGVIQSGALARATRAGGIGALRSTIRNTVLWTSFIGTVIAVGSAWYFASRDPVAELTVKQYLTVAIGSGVTGFIVGMGFFGFFCQTGESVSASHQSLSPRHPHLTYPEHYEQTDRQAHGERCEMSLIQAAMDGPLVTLVYQWQLDLPDEDAGRLDTRARAYIACAIYDAATTAGLSCQPGPPHGQRPSWHVAGDKTPISLVNAGFDVSDKTCFMQIGAGMMIVARPQSGWRYGKELLSGFQAQFSQIRV